MFSHTAQHAIESSTAVNAPGNPDLAFPMVISHLPPAPTAGFLTPVLHVYRVIDEAVVDLSLGSFGFGLYRVYVCLVCSKQFSDLISARLHVHKLHLHTRQPLECTGCNAKFTEKTSAQRHVDNREKRFRCYFCRKSFARSDYLLSHRRNCARRVAA